jgi:GNAT superfamily N-acetyltransferase
MDLKIREVDFDDRDDAARFIGVLNSYASDPAGGGEPLAQDVRERLIPSLRDHPTALVLLACVGDEPAGIAVCFFGFSTFRARPLLNVHDLAVTPKYRGRGIGRALLGECERRALRDGCCKLTLEVQDDNARARALYKSFGFEEFVVANSFTRFLAKPLHVRIE